MGTDKKQLLKFISESHKSGYATGDSANKIKEPDGSTTITYESGPWKYHDNYFGGEPYGGREVVFFKDKPVWMMTYYGRVDNSVKDFIRVYNFLQRALKLVPLDRPFRGPKELREGSFKYQNTWQGVVSGFSGKEVIYENEKVVYEANYTGGFVDIRKE